MSTQIKPIDEVRMSLEKMGPQFKAALPKHVTIEKFQRVVMTALQGNPDLLTCNKMSLYGAAMKAAQDGLLPDGREAALVKFKDQVSYMPMVAGLLKKVRNSGELKTITSQTVYEKDRFRYWVDSDGEHLEHEPNFFVNRGERIGVYALATTKDGGIFIEVMGKEAVEDVKKVSRAQSGPWSGPFVGEMWRKTAIRRLSKRLPMNTDLEQSIDADKELFEPEAPAKPETVNVEQETEPAPIKKSRLKTLIQTGAPVVETKEEIPLPPEPTGEFQEFETPFDGPEPKPAPNFDEMINNIKANQRV